MDNISNLQNVGYVIVTLSLDPDIETSSITQLLGKIVFENSSDRECI